jgi:hypothetical protein
MSAVWLALMVCLFVVVTDSEGRLETLAELVDLVVVVAEPAWRMVSVARHVVVPWSMHGASESQLDRLACVRCEVCSSARSALPLAVRALLHTCSHCGFCC